MAPSHPEREDRKRQSLFPGLDRLGEHMVSLYGARPEEATDPLTAADWTPSVDVLKTDTEYTIRAELPGTTKEDVHVRLDAGVLTIEGERKQEAKQEQSQYLRIECAYGYFLRRFVLPPDALSSGISAAHRDGVLSVTIPRQTAASDDKTIPIS